MMGGGSTNGDQPVPETEPTYFHSMMNMAMFGFKAYQCLPEHTAVGRIGEIVPAVPPNVE